MEIPLVCPFRKCAWSIIECFEVIDLIGRGAHWVVPTSDAVRQQYFQNEMKSEMEKKAKSETQNDVKS